MTTQSEITAARVEALQAAFEHGRNWALNLRKGDRFIGCMPVARELYPHDEGRVAVFMDGALAVLKAARVMTDMNGILLANIAPPQQARSSRPFGDPTADYRR